MLAADAGLITKNWMYSHVWPKILSQHLTENLSIVPQLTKKVFSIFLINCAYADCCMKLFVETVWHNALICQAKDAQLEHVMQQWLRFAGVEC